jgi:hypothetical protein
MNNPIQQLEENVKTARAAYQQHMENHPLKINKEYPAWVAKSAKLHQAIWQAEMQLVREQIVQPVTK